MVTYLMGRNLSFPIVKVDCNKYISRSLHTAEYISLTLRLSFGAILTGTPIDNPPLQITPSIEPIHSPFPMNLVHHIPQTPSKYDPLCKRKRIRRIECITFFRILVSTSILSTMHRITTHFHTQSNPNGKGDGPTNTSISEGPPSMT